MERIAEIIVSDNVIDQVAIPIPLGSVWRSPMIVEVRSYRIKPGRREEFIKFFETRSIPALRSHGMKILGPLLDLENPNKFVFLAQFSFA